MNFFAFHKKSYYGQSEYVLSSRSDLQLWMTYNMWMFLRLLKKSCYGQREYDFSSRSGLQLWMTFITRIFSLFIKSCNGQHAFVFFSRSGLQLWMAFITWTFSIFKKIVLWSTWVLKSWCSSTLNDIQHMYFLFIQNHVMVHVRVLSQVVVVFKFIDIHHMTFFVHHKKSCYGQCKYVFWSLSVLQLWMTFNTWMFSLFIKNHV